MADRPEKLLWIDLEMTGLRPQTDRIIEVAAIVTDFDLREIASYQSAVKHPERLLRTLVGESAWHLTQPEYTERVVSDSLKGKTEKVVQTELIGFVEQHIGLSQKPELYPFTQGSLEAKGEVYLAGNSIATDRAFIDQWWLEFARILHYRMLDVSSFKLWHLAKGGQKFQKQMKHRALDDIRESIAEFRSYVGTDR